MVLTVPEATVTPERAVDLQAAFRAAATQVPPGFIRSHLVSTTADPARWRIETLWTSREALVAMRHAGTPARRRAGSCSARREPNPRSASATWRPPSSRRLPDGVGADSDLRIA